MVASPSRTGTTTVTVGTSGTDRLRSCRPHGDSRQRLGAAAIVSESAGQVVASLVLDREHAGVAGRVERGRERIEAVARSGKQGLHVMALPVATQQTRD